MIKKTCQIIPINLGMVYAFLLKGENAKSILIDCGIPGSDKAILKQMADAGIGINDLQCMILTHGHSDHMGASSALRDATGAKTMIHTLDADVVRTGMNPKLTPTNFKGKLFSRFAGGAVKGFVPYEPELVINGEQSLHEFGINGRVIETPGHTNGSVSVVLEDGAVFVGDLLMGGMFKKGKPNLPMYADSLEQTKANIQKVILLSPKIFYTGHGGPFSVDEVKSSLGF